MRDILEEIIAHKRIELEQFRQQLGEQELHAEAERMMDDKSILPSMAESIRLSSNGIIAEFKRKSPSKGWIKEEGKAESIPLSYQKAGAAAVSILTDSHYFGGSDSFILKACQSGVTIPRLYKNFIIDEYQLFQARICGATTVLLIAACLSKEEYRGLLHQAHNLQMEVLLEMHSEAELAYIDMAMPDLCGINNRNLGTFITDVGNSFRLGEKLPAESVKVSESGISSPSTILQLREAGFQGFLIGECFMKESQPGEALKTFIQKLEE